MSLFCTVSEILSVISKNMKRSHDPEHILIGGSLSVSTRNVKCLVLLVRKIWRRPQISKVGHVTLTTPLSGGVCQPKANTSCSLLVCKITKLLNLNICRTWKSFYMNIVTRSLVLLEMFVRFVYFNSVWTANWLSNAWHVTLRSSVDKIVYL